MRKFLVGFTTSVLVDADTHEEAIETARDKVMKHPRYLREVYSSDNQDFINQAERAMGYCHVR